MNNGFVKKFRHLHKVLKADVLMIDQKAGWSFGLWISLLPEPPALSAHFGFALGAFNFSAIGSRIFVFRAKTAKIPVF